MPSSEDLQRVPQTHTYAGLDARMLVELMAPAQVGDVVTYEEMTTLLGKQIQQRRDLLYTAMSILQERDNMVFAPVNGVGMVRLANPEKVTYGGTKTQRIARSARRNIKMLATVAREELSALDQHRLDAQVTIMAAVNMYTHTRTVEALEQGTRLPQAVPFDRQVHARLATLWGP